MRFEKLKKIFTAVLALLFLTTFFAGCSNQPLKNVGQNTGTAPSYSVEFLQRADMLRVHFIDVGQGDSILVHFPNGKNMLIDAGPPAAAGTVKNYLRSNGVNSIDYLVATHPHSDHIGAMDDIIKTFQIGEFFMPGVTTTTQAFYDLLTSLRIKGLQFTTAKSGVTIMQDGNLSAFFLAPVRNKYEGLNNYSAVIKIKWGKTSFLFTGDAEEKSEFEMLASSIDTLFADVLKVGHHGSQSSTSYEFLEAVNPRYAIISAGRNNDYHHPHQTTIDKLDKAGVAVLRTDENGTIVFGADENGIIVYKKGKE